MAAQLDLQHVRNVGERLSQHYLDTLLARDLKPLFAAWREASAETGAPTPDRRLAALAEPYFRTLALVMRGSAEQRAAASSRFHAALARALGYEPAPTRVELPGGATLPLTLALRERGRPRLWVGEAAFPRSEDAADPFASAPIDPARARPPGARAKGHVETDSAMSWRALLDGPALRQEHAPRWVLLLAGPDALLVDRDRWPQGQYLHVELGAALGHRAPAALRAAAALLHRDTIAPAGRRSVLDELDERSHRHAFAVSTELKRGVQRAIELLGNEALRARRRAGLERPSARALTRECILYVYRLLALLYLEAREDGPAALMSAEAYREGLSLESLRALELVELHTTRAREGYFFQRSLDTLLRALYRGWPPRQVVLRTEVTAETRADPGALQIPALRAPLLSPASTPILSATALPNHALQGIIRLLSLTREGHGARARVSYATLGINQLGAVYEGLLAHTGMIADEPLIELQAPPGRTRDASRVLFTPASRAGNYRDDELRRDPETGATLEHPAGTFLFRLAGRARERSASYYTPELLARSLTQHTLRERLESLSADAILELTICEPAMGSGAFLSEAVGQLASAYLERKQRELGRVIPAEDYAREHARVRSHFVARRCYGVDLNPLACELAKLSLWLGALPLERDAKQELPPPPLELRLRVGDSLIGARREVYAPALLRDGRWQDVAPTRVSPPQTRPKGHVYHFLASAAGMAGYEGDAVARRLCPGEVAALKRWRAASRRPYAPDELARLQALSDELDVLWAQHLQTRQRALARGRVATPLWGQVHPKTPASSTDDSAPPETSGDAYARLRAVMDLWCSLWTWPLERAAELPDRAAWLAGVEALLRGPIELARAAALPGRFHHWELEFCEVFAARGGFDLIIGNPPWIKREWREAEVLRELDPRLALRGRGAAEIAARRDEVLQAPGARQRYLAALSERLGALRFLSAPSNFPRLQGVQTNLYKCFLVRCWGLLARRGVQGMLHQPGVFDDPRGGALRAELAERAALLVRAKNQLKLFPEVEHQRPYAWSITRGARAAPRFTLVANLLHPATLDGSWTHDGDGPVPGIKDARGQWDLRPHRSRLVEINDDDLRLFARLYDPPGTPRRAARLPALHSRELLATLRRFADAPRTLADLRGEYFCTEHFHETNRQADGTIRREVRAPASAREWIVSGPQLDVGNPLSKSPAPGCRGNHDYGVIDLTQIPADFLPRTNYVPGPAPRYEARTPTWRGAPTTRHYRYANRTMVAPTGARTLIPAILPPGPAHIDLVFSIVFADPRDLLLASGLWASLPVDFFVRSTGKGHARADVLSQLPLPVTRLAPVVIDRALRLNCLTQHYAALWSAQLPPAPFASARRGDPRTAGWEHAPRRWSWRAPLRTPFARRQARVELDALAALSLGLTLAELLHLYRVQFPVLRQYEAETYYDRRGKIVFTIDRRRAGVGLPRARWRELRRAVERDPSARPEWARDAGGPFAPPFDRCDREADMRQAYAHFDRALTASVERP